MAQMTVLELAKAINGTVHGNGDILIEGAATINDATASDIVAAESDKYLQEAKNCPAGAVVTSASECGDKTVIQVKDPKTAFVNVLDLFAPEIKIPEPGIDPSARIGERFSAGNNVSIGFGCWIGDDVTIGEGTIIHPLCYIGDGVRIGANTVIYPRVMVYWGCKIGSSVSLHSGCVIGGDGFGYIPSAAGLRKIPQIGDVIIEDDVEIGTNAVVDRAKTGSTVIGRGTKIDNLVHIAHNVKTGQCCVIIAQVGIAGSTELGNGVTLAGQVGVKDHIKIGDGATVGGQAGVFGDLPGGATYSGYPARAHKESLRVQANVHRLPDTYKVIDALKKEVESLKQRLDELDGGK